MAEYIAVEGMTLVVESGPPPASAPAASLSVLSPATPPVAKASSGGNGIYKDGLVIKVENAIDSGLGATIPDPLTIPPAFLVVSLETTAFKVKADGTLVLREGDVSNLLTFAPLVPGSPPVAVSSSLKAKISMAGQTKVKAE